MRWLFLDYWRLFGWLFGGVGATIVGTSFAQFLARRRQQAAAEKASPARALANVVRTSVRQAWLERYGEVWGVGDEFGDQGIIVALKNEARTDKPNVGALARAHIILRHPDGTEHTSFCGQWLEQPSGVAEFRVDETRNLILGLIRDGNLCGLENIRMPDSEGDGYTTRIHFLNNYTEGVVTVRLTNADTGDVLYQSDFKFATGPFSVDGVDSEPNLALAPKVVSAQLDESAERFSNSDKLAIALTFVGLAAAILLALITPLLEKAKTATVLLLLGSLCLCLIYPVMHFFRNWQWRILTFAGLAIGTAGFGILLLQQRQEVVGQPRTAGQSIIQESASSITEQAAPIKPPPLPEAGSRPHIGSDVGKKSTRINHAAVPGTDRGIDGEIAPGTLTVSHTDRVSTDPDAPFESQIVIATTKHLPGLNSVVIHCDGKLAAWSWTSPDRNTVKYSINGDSFEFPFSSLRYGLTPQFDPAHPLVFLVWSSHAVKCNHVETF